MEDFRSTLGSTQTDRFRSPASFTAHERLSPCRLTMTSNIVGSGSPPPSTLKDEYEERQRLERQNFDLKLKVFHLEENIKKLQDVEVRHEVNSGIVRSEVSDLRLQLEEKDIELEQRNLLLMKAKAAIESMRQDLDNSRRDLEKQFDLEERVKRLKQMNDDIELDYKNQLLKLETELNSTRQSLGIREQEKSLLEEKVRQVELTVANLQDAIDKQNVEKGRMDDRWMQSQQRILALEEEYTQARAHIDLYKLQAQEANDESEAIAEQLKELSLRKKEQEDAHRQHVQELSNQYEVQVRTIRANHEHDVEKLRTSHAQLLQDIRDNYQKELQQARSHMERTLLDWKAVENVDVQRVREDFQRRLEEKSSEVKAFQAILQGDRVKFETLAQELETVRQEAREKTVQVEQLRRELTVKTEELRLAATHHADLLATQKQLAEAQDQLRIELLDKSHIRQKLEQTEDLLQSARQHSQELEAQVLVHQNEVQRLTQTSSELGNKADGVESLARENEKLRLLHHKLQTDLLEANHKLVLCGKEREQVDAVVARLQDDVRDLREAARARADSLEDCQRRADALTHSLHEERQTRTAAEACLSEQRASHVRLQAEMTEMREKLRVCEGRAVAEVEEVEQRLHRMVQASALARRSLLECDEALTTALDGAGSGTAAPVPSFFSSRLGSAPPPRRPAAGRSGSVGERLYERSGEDYDHARELAERGGEELRHELAVLIERVCLKLDRVVKIRLLFDSVAVSASANAENAVKQWAEKCLLLTHRVDQANAQLALLKTTFDRDRATSKHELEEVKKLREVLLAEHASSLREHEERYAQLLLAREQEKVHHEHLKRAHERVLEELRNTQEILAQKKEELREFDQAESRLADCERRVHALTDTNKQLLKELHAKEQELQGAEQTWQELQNRHKQLAGDFEGVTSKLQMKEDVLHETEVRVQKLQAEIERLRARQIDPDLAQTLRASHEQIKRSETHSWSGQRALSANLVADMKEMEVSVRGLLRKSELLVTRVEAYGGSAESRSTLDGDRFQRLREEVRHLLTENYSLVQKLEGVLAQVRSGADGLGEETVMRLGAGGGSPNGLGSNATSPSAKSAKAIAAEIAASATRRSVPESPVYSVSARPGDSSGYPSSWYASSTAAGSRAARPASVRQSQPPPPPPFQQQAAATSAATSASRTAAASGESYYFPSRRGLMNASMTPRDYLGGNDLGPGPSIQLDDLREGSELSRHRLSSARSSREEQTNGVQRMSRLQKIDHNLKALTQKLDNFDLGRLHD